MKKNLITDVMRNMVVFFLLVWPLVGIAKIKDVPILDFASFEKMMKRESDTIFIYNFWATWCKPCVEELPYFEKLTENYKSKPVKVVLVSLDFRSQYERKVIPFVEKNNLKSDVILLDAPNYNDWLDKVSPIWSGAIPATLVVHTSSNSNKFYEKQLTYPELENIVKPLLKF